MAYPDNPEVAFSYSFQIYDDSGYTCTCLGYLGRQDINKANQGIPTEGKGCSIQLTSNVLI
jgi:hypothetical protein